MPLRLAIAALVLCVVSGTAAAADLIGYSEAFNALYRVDITTRTATEIGYSVSPYNSIIKGLTFSPGGTLYGINDGRTVKTLVRIDVNTGLASPVGTLNLGTSDTLDLGMAFTCDGQLWLAATTGQFWKINPGNAQVTSIGNLGVTITGLAARGNKLYGAGGQNNNNFYSIDPTAGTATLIGAFGDPDFITVTSPAFDQDGNLWAILDYVPPEFDNSQTPRWSDLASISPNSGTLSNLGNITASGNSVTDLEYVGLRGLAIPSAVCAGTQIASTPSLSGWALLALIALLGLGAGTRLSPRRQTV